MSVDVACSCNSYSLLLTPAKRTGACGKQISKYEALTKSQTKSPKMLLFLWCLQSQKTVTLSILSIFLGKTSLLN